jgi:DnaJ-class molecular chaperone
MEILDAEVAEQCQTCKGVGSLACPKCHGESVSVDNAPARSCDVCKSTGKVKCPTCHGLSPIPPE